MSRKITKYIFAVLVIVMVVGLSGPSVMAAVKYDYEFVSQSDYPIVAKGGQATLSITLKNTGNTTWYNYGVHPMHLGTYLLPGEQYRDWDSQFYTAGSWLTKNRINMDQAEVRPGQNATFTFIITAPNQDRNDKEYFRPVIEGLFWLKDIGIYWEIKTGALNPFSGSYYYKYLNQNIIPPIVAGSTTIMSLMIKNTGTATWYKNQINLGTSRPEDRDSGFYDSSWLTPNRIAMKEDSVAPGEVATFNFTITPRSDLLGTYYESFTPVREGIGWLGDAGIYWPITVTVAGKPLDHILLSPTYVSVSLYTGGEFQFYASAYDTSGVLIGSLPISWSVVAGGGSIDSSGLFTAGSSTGTFTNTVKTVATYGGVTKEAYATVSVTP